MTFWIKSEHRDPSKKTFILRHRHLPRFTCTATITATITLPPCHHHHLQVSTTLTSIGPGGVGWGFLGCCWPGPWSLLFSPLLSPPLISYILRRRQGGFVQFSVSLQFSVSHQVQGCSSDRLQLEPSTCTVYSGRGLCSGKRANGSAHVQPSS